MSQVRVRVGFRLLTVVTALSAYGCGSGTPPLPKPISGPVEKAEPAKKGAKKGRNVDTSTDPDSSHHLRRKSLENSQPK